MTKSVTPPPLPLKISHRGVGGGAIKGGYRFLKTSFSTIFIKFSNGIFFSEQRWLNWRMGEHPPMKKAWWCTPPPFLPKIRCMWQLLSTFWPRIFSGISYSVKKMFSLLKCSLENVLLVKSQLKSLRCQLKFQVYDFPLYFILVGKFYVYFEFFYYDSNF